MGSGEDAQFVFAKYDYTAQGNQVKTHNFVKVPPNYDKLERSFFKFTLKEG